MTQKKAGEIIQLEIIRDGKALTIDFQLLYGTDTHLFFEMENSNDKVMELRQALTKYE